MKKLGLIVFAISFLLILLGLIMVMTASSAYSAFKFDSVFHLFNSQLENALIGFFIMIAFCFIPYELYKDYSKPAMFVTVFVLLLTLFIAPDLNGAGRWIDLGFISFQPADLARMVLIIHLASLIEDKRESLKNYKHGFLYLFIWVLIVAGLIILQPNISTAIIIFMISLTLLYVGGAKIGHILTSSVFCLFVGGIAALIFPHSRERIFAFIDSIVTGGSINIQVKQAVLGLGSGGIFGVGLGHSMQNNLFLPEAYGDFIFAILGEELGFIGAIILLLCYLTLFFSGVVIAKRTNDKFGQLLAFGMSFSIIIYAFINIAVATGLVPTTGLPLPFISYGGTSIVFLCISVGILVNIAFSNSIENNPIKNLGNPNQNLQNERGKKII